MHFITAPFHAFAGFIQLIVDTILGLHGAVAYLLVAGLAFGEAAVLLGFVIPGETAVILGGVLASEGRVSLGLMLPVAIVSAIAGDSVGYEVGRHFGPSILGWRPFRGQQGKIEMARRFLHRRGTMAVFLGRFTAFLRAMVPGLAGMAGMPYPRFLMANAAGGIVWATGFTLLGYFLGHAYKRVERVSTDASAGLLLVIVAVMVGLHLHKKARERRMELEGRSLRKTTAGDGDVGVGDAGVGGRPSSSSGSGSATSPSSRPG